MIPANGSGTGEAVFGGANNTTMCVSVAVI